MEDSISIEEVAKLLPILRKLELQLEATKESFRIILAMITVCLDNIASTTSPETFSHFLSVDEDGNSMTVHEANELVASNVECLMGELKTLRQDKEAKKAEMILLNKKIQTTKEKIGWQ